MFHNLLTLILFTYIFDTYPFQNIDVLHISKGMHKDITLHIYITQICTPTNILILETN